MLGSTCRLGVSDPPEKRGNSRFSGWTCGVGGRQRCSRAEHEDRSTTHFVTAIQHAPTEDFIVGHRSCVSHVLPYIWQADKNSIQLRQGGSRVLSFRNSYHKTIEGCMITTVANTTLYMSCMTYISSSTRLGCQDCSVTDTISPRNRTYGRIALFQDLESFRAMKPPILVVRMSCQFTGDVAPLYSTMFIYLRCTFQQLTDGYLDKLRRQHKQFI